MMRTRCNRQPTEFLLCRSVIVGCWALLCLVTVGCEHKSLPAASVSVDRTSAQVRTASHETTVTPSSDVQLSSGISAATTSTSETSAPAADEGAFQSAEGELRARDSDVSTAKSSEPIAAQPNKPAEKDSPSTPAKSNELRECTFDTIKFNMVKGDPFHRKLLTPQIEALDGQRIRIRGYMLPSLYQKGLTEFVLVRDNMECCFGPGAALFDCIFIQFEPGKTADFSVRPVAVEGKFSIQVLPGPDGYPLAIYHLLASDLR